jgi:hypothetical protein
MTSYLIRTTPQRSARHAKRALKYYGPIRPFAITDLLVDLMHLSEAESLKFHLLLELAITKYYEEREKK